ncbi:hypothetical protein B0T20DRAFT_56640 [Sordaria brevicollis]|uniref:Uncharacterized protein n=1 Tax=Sordaria brevicollis TaxID=83679 RepID=A0AAE0P3S0_SORBR|nr:hypothetical protein B0T20DRAFT_56640 [Sordaria brevicollis]
MRERYSIWLAIYTCICLSGERECPVGSKGVDLIVIPPLPMWMRFCVKFGDLKTDEICSEWTRPNPTVLCFPFCDIMMTWSVFLFH